MVHDGLGCCSSQVCGAILACWASLYSFPAVRYRHQRGQLIPSLMGVVIQQMVPAEAAGEMLVCTPVLSPQFFSLGFVHGLCVLLQQPWRPLINPCSGLASISA